MDGIDSKGGKSMTKEMCGRFAMAAAVFDADGWERARVTGPDGKVFDVDNGAGLKDIGSTEVFTESAEPELCPEEEEGVCDLQAAIDEFLMMFPEGEYEFEGRTIEGDWLEGDATLSWDLPDPVEIIDAEGNFPTIEWTASDGIEVVAYQVVAEMVAEDDEGEELLYVQATDVPADITSIDTSPQFAQLAQDLMDDESLLELKVEIIAVGANGNKTITEEAIFEAEEE
jgi:hypothetical protein